ncbi:MAG: alpha/beta hydrolase [Ktedonobacteraceae bacterium]
MLKTSFHTVKVNKYTVRYQTIGEGEPVVLVHGLSGSTLWWRRNVSALAQQYRVYLVDLPGFGAGSRKHGRFALKQAGDWLVSWMDAIGLKQTHLIGHSMGGYICMWIAAHHPDVVLRLVLVAPAFKARARSVLGYIVPLLSTTRYLTPHFFPILAYDSLRAGPITLLKATRDLITLDVSEELNLITQPVLLVWGENDTLVPLSLGHMLREELPNARLLTLEHAAHVAMFDQPQEFNAAVNTFLRGEMLGE